MIYCTTYIMSLSSVDIKRLLAKSHTHTKQTQKGECHEENHYFSSPGSERTDKHD